MNQLHFQRLHSGDSRGPPSAWLMMLHGAFGQGRNWATVAKKFLQQKPSWGVVLVDLREHGESVGISGSPTIQQAAEDLELVAASLDGPCVAVCGHSFGGKVALAWTASPSRRTPLEQVWIVDSTPAPVPRESGEAWRMLQLIRRLPDTFPSRAAAAEAMQSAGLSSPIAAWMATNLQRTGEQVHWRFNIDALEPLLLDFYTTDLWPVVDLPPTDVRLHFIKATQSDLIDTTTAARILSAAETTGRVFLHEIPGGHWLNSDNPDGIVELLDALLPIPPD
jgi:esterase